MKKIWAGIGVIFAAFVVTIGNILVVTKAETASTSVEYVEYFGDDTVTDIDLSHIVSVELDATFYACPNLERIDLSNLKDLSVLDIAYNDKLTEIKVGKLTEVGSIAIESCYGLTKLDLSSLEAVYGYLQITDCPNLEEINLGNLYACMAVINDRGGINFTIDLSKLEGLKRLYLHEGNYAGVKFNSKVELVTVKHSFVNGACSICGVCTEQLANGSHKYDSNGICTVCKNPCSHVGQKHNEICEKCGLIVPDKHRFYLEECLICDAIKSGCGQDAFYIISEPDMYICGEGVTTNFASSGEVIWKSQSAHISRLVIEEGITTLGNYTFYGMSNLEELVIPASVTSIPRNALNDCSKLTIKCVKGSYAEEYAKDYEIPYEYYESKNGWNYSDAYRNWGMFVNDRIDRDYNGLYYNDGQLKTVIDGWFAYDYSGFYANEDEEVYYVVDGVVDTSLDGFRCVEGVWCVFENGKVDTEYTGVLLYNGNYWYVKEGILDKNVSDLVSVEGKVAYVVGGRVKTEANGLKYVNGKWGYVVKGWVDTDYNGLVIYNGDYWYVNNGFLDKSYNGFCNGKGIEGTYWVAAGKARLDGNGLKYAGGTWAYVKNGRVQEQYSGLVEYNGNYWYVTGGYLDKKVSGIVEMSGKEYFVKNGLYDSNANGLKWLGGEWYYVKNGVADRDYTGLYYINNKWWYITNGGLDKNYSGLVKYNGKLWYVTEGILDKAYIGTCEYMGIIYSVRDGVGTK